MSKLTRTLAAGVALAAISLAGMTTVAHAQPTDEPTRHHARPPTQGQVGEAWHQHSQQQTPTDATVRRLLARERSTIPNQPSARVPAPAPNQPNRQPSWVLVSLGVLAVLVLAVGLAVLATRRASRRIRPRAASLPR
jgi:CHASE1-domain containing sensor protein